MLIENRYVEGGEARVGIIATVVCLVGLPIIISRSPCNTHSSEIIPAPRTGVAVNRIRLVLLFSLADGKYEVVVREDLNSPSSSSCSPSQCISIN